MSKFLKHHDRTVYPDLSTDLRDALDWNVGVLRSFEYPLEIGALAIESLSGLLAVGTVGAIHIFGRPGVESKLTLPAAARVKFLQFAPSLYRLVCVDDTDQLHLWDLKTHGRPKLLSSTRFDRVTCLTLSPSHTHAFLALQSGEIRTYDLLCLRKSAYTVPNMWTLYEKSMVATGMPVEPDATSHMPLDVLIHPRDLNLILAAYGGGVILSDLTQRNTLRAYQHVLVAGAPGGAGYTAQNLFTHRRPSVTALAMHPAGHFFAVGYSDGSIGFWAVEDDELPLLVRTIEEIDVNFIDGDKLEKYLPQGTRTEKALRPSSSTEREPIFKLSWSLFSNFPDPRGGETALTILGGLYSGTAGVTVFWLPAFNPPEPPASPDPPTGLHPFTRNAMRESLMPTQTYFYNTIGITQDFLLIPRNNPHFAGSSDPIAILLLSESQGDARIIDAYDFPPPAFLAAMPVESEEKRNVSVKRESCSDTLAEDLASTLQAMEMNQAPRRLRLPPPLANGGSGFMDGRLFKVERDTYEKLVKQSDTNGGDLPLNGGFAWADDSQVKERTHSKYQPHRILITTHRDLVVQFQDISAQLLISSGTNPIENHYPKLLPDLAIDLTSLLNDPLVSKRASQALLQYPVITSIQLAMESLECSLVMETGELIVYRLSAGAEEHPVYHESPDKELLILEHVPRQRGHRFYPDLMLAPGKGPLTAFATSDIGFLATAYGDGSLYVVDMRTPKIMLRHSAQKKHTVHLKRHPDLDPVSSLVFTISALSSDPRPLVRLIAVHISGLTNVFTLVRRSGSTWSIDLEPVKTETIENIFPRANYILDSKTGLQRKPNRSRLAAALEPEAEARSMWITAGTKGVRCTSDITGERIGKAEWGSKVGIVQSVEVIERSGSHVLVAFTDRHEALVYSLPHIEHLHTLQLPLISPSPISADESGDLIQWTRQPGSRMMMHATYATLFNFRRAYTLPDIDFASTAPTVPPQPQPVATGPTSLLSSWFRFGQSMTGEQLDDLLGGPDRPVPEESKSDISSMTLPSVAGVTEAATAAQNSLYDRLNSVLDQRGQMLGELGERFSSLEEGSRGVVEQAKRLAAEQTAKGWLGFGIGGL